MKIAVVGTGYVGLVSGACFSDMGMDVTCVDIDRAKIDNLNAGVIPIYEPGLEELVIKNKNAGRLRFTTDLVERINEYDAIFCAVGTPPGEDGGADLKHVLDVARTVGRHMNRYVVFVTKSTVPVGTGQKVREVIREELDKRGVAVDFDIASNPEFLKEGAAISDFMSPDRIVVGLENDRAKDIMDRIYKPFLLNNYRIIYTDIPSAEMIKYASNAMLATRISFMNDIANLCELVGADVDMVRKGMGTDARIGNKFLYAGCGYGGSCFPKDVRALAQTGRQMGHPLRIIEAVDEVNTRQKNKIFEKLQKAFGGDLKDKTVALWGLSFKPETDDMREAPSLVVIEQLLEAGAEVKAFDPVAMEECRRRFGDRISYGRDMYDVTEQADALVLLTEWKQFRLPNWRMIHKAMKNPILIDGRNIYEAEEMKEFGFYYDRIGRKKD